VNILLSYASEYDTGEGVHYARVLRRLGHEVYEINTAAREKSPNRPGRVVRGYPSYITIQELLDEYQKVDLYLYIEPLGLIPLGLESSPIPTACVLCDTHRNPKARRTVSTLFDHVFVYHRNHVNFYYDREPGTTHWMPYACDTETVRNLGLHRDVDLAFVGRLYTKERRRLIGALSRRYRMNEQRYYLQCEIPDLYSRAKVVVDLPDGDNIPFRVFEAMSCGALLMTRRMPSGLEDLFVEGVHYLAFGTDDELIEKVENYLQNDEERKRIASHGHKEVMQKHTLAQRLEMLFSAMHNGPKMSAPVRKMSKNQVLKVYAAVYERMGKVETLLKLATEERANTKARYRLLAMAAKSFLRRMVLRW